LFLTTSSLEPLSCSAISFCKLIEKVNKCWVVNTQVLGEQKRDLDERINLCKREMTSEMVEKQGEIQDVLF
jgi:hypothetical protein